MVCSLKGLSGVRECVLRLDVGLRLDTETVRLSQFVWPCTLYSLIYIQCFLLASAALKSKMEFADFISDLLSVNQWCLGLHNQFEGGGGGLLLPVISTCLHTICFWSQMFISNSAKSSPSHYRKKVKQMQKKRVTSGSICIHNLQMEAWHSCNCNYTCLFSQLWTVSVRGRTENTQCRLQTFLFIMLQWQWHRGR